MEKSPNYETKSNDYHETRINNDSNQVGNKEKAGNLLDNNHYLAAMDKYDIIGAACDVKPVTEFRIDIPIIQQKDVCNEIEDILENLELKHTTISETYSEGSENPEYVYIQYFVSKSEKNMLLAKAISLGEVNPIEILENESEDNSIRNLVVSSIAKMLFAGTIDLENLDLAHFTKQASLGKLFGYPESAIKYQLERVFSTKTFYPTNSKVTYIHNPEKIESELEQYENRINPFFKQLCPKSNEELSKSIPKNNQ